MNKSEAVRAALKEGLLLSPQCLGLCDDDLKNFILQTKKEGRIVVQPEKIMITTRTTKNHQLTPAEYITYFNSKYTGLKSIIEKKTSTVAINKIGSGQSTIVGMVRERTDRGFLAEDPTGQIEVISREQPEQDSVIGIQGFARDGKLWSDQLIWPDVPLTHNPTNIQGCMVSVKGRTIQIENHLVEVSSNPLWIKISKDTQTVNILVYHTDIPQPKTWLKLRHLNPGINEITSTEDLWLLDPIPDLIWIISEKRFKDIYRGVTIFSSGTCQAKIDFSNWEIHFTEENTTA